MSEIKISLAAARVNARMTQDEVSRKLHVSKKTIVNWENGKAKPSFASLSAMSQLYEIPIDNILMTCALYHTSERSCNERRGDIRIGHPDGNL